MIHTIPSYDFYKTKYGEELLIDVVDLNYIKKYIRIHPIHQLSYFDITFITGGTGFVAIDNRKYAVAPGDVIFSMPGEIRAWEKNHQLTGYALIFEEAFLLSFFNDPLFLQNLLTSTMRHPKTISKNSYRTRVLSFCALPSSA